MSAYNFAMETFREDIEGNVPLGTPKDKVEDVLKAVAEAFVESFRYSRSRRRPFESLDRHEDFWRGTGELDMAIDEARESIGVPDDDGEDEEQWSAAALVESSGARIPARNSQLTGGRGHGEE